MARPSAAGQGESSPFPVHDFHTHSTLSDGALSPLELIRRATVAGYVAIAITDHAGPGSLERLIREVERDCQVAMGEWGIVALPGVELTHVPPGAIAEAAAAARRAGALVVVVHGETVDEPVAPGTNRAAIECGEVDILAHPGLITWEDAQLAAQKGIFLELSAKPAHAVANGHVARMAKMAGARLLVSSDNHALDFLTPQRIRQVILGAGLTEDDVEEIGIRNPHLLLERALGRARAR